MTSEKVGAGAKVHTSGENNSLLQIVMSLSVLHTACHDKYASNSSIRPSKSRLKDALFVLQMYLHIPLHPWENCNNVATVFCLEGLRIQH
jgi:hypothetical protein